MAAKETWWCIDVLKHLHWPGSFILIPQRNPLKASNLKVLDILSSTKTRHWCKSADRRTERLSRCWRCSSFRIGWIVVCRGFLFLFSLGNSRGLLMSLFAVDSLSSDVASVQLSIINGPKRKRPRDENWKASKDKANVDSSDCVGEVEAGEWCWRIAGRVSWSEEGEVVKKVGWWDEKGLVIDYTSGRIKSRLASGNATMQGID